MWLVRNFIFISLLSLSFASFTSAAPITRTKASEALSLLSSSSILSNSPVNAKGEKKSFKIQMGGHTKKFLNRLGKKPKMSSKIGDPGPEDDLQDDGYDGEYDAQMTFGNQTLDIQLDTGSALLMVYSEQFISQYQLGQGDESVRAAPFLPSSNTTILKDFKCGVQECVYAYGDGSDYTFDLVQDSVSLGGVTVQNQPFALAKAGSFSTPGTISGILGLGWSTSNAGSLRSKTNTTPLVQQMFEGGVLQVPLFSFAMLRNAQQSTTNWTSEAKGGFFTLGELDKEQYDGDVKWKPLRSSDGSNDTQPETWSSSLDQIMVNGKEVEGSEELTALWDTGTAGIALPLEIIHGIFSKAKAEDAPQIYEDGTVSGPCPSLKDKTASPPLDLTVRYGGQDFPVEVEDLVSSRMETEDKKLICNYVISSTEGIAVFGASFLKNVFSVFSFSPPSIGMAKLSRAFEKDQPKDLSKPNTQADGPAAIQTISGIWGSVASVATPTVSASAFEKGSPIRATGGDSFQPTSLSLSLAPSALGGGENTTATATATSVDSSYPSPIPTGLLSQLTSSGMSLVGSSV